MNKRFVLTLMALCLAFLPLAAQTVQVSGTVLDESGQAIAGAGVLEAGTLNGTVTDVDGNYSLSVSSPQASLEVSFMGFVTEVIPVGTRSRIDVVLKEDSTVLDEVMVIGYGTVKKKDLTGSIAAVDGGKIATIQAAGLSQALQGSMPGVQVTRTSGLPGASATIRVRGITTIGDSDPLIIVDGVPVSSLDDVDVDAIENITVLKDAASAAIYGARASAGVLLVTTKRAKTGQLHIDYNGSFSLMSRTAHPKQVSVTRFMELQNEAQWNDAGMPAGREDFQYEQSYIDNYIANNAVDPDNYPITDWDSLMIEKVAPQHKHRLSVTYGNENIKSRAMLSYADEEALYYGRGREDYNARLNNDIKINDFISASIDMTFNHRYSRNNQVNPVQAAFKYNPIYVSVWSDGTYGPGNNGTNTLARLHAGGFDNTERNAFYGKASLIITPFKDFTITGVFAPSFRNSKEKDYVQKAYYYREPGILSENPLSGCTSTKLIESRTESKDFTTQLLLNYKKDFGKAVRTTYMAGYEQYYATSESLKVGSDQMNWEGFPYMKLANTNFLVSYDDDQNIVFPTGNASENAYRSWFGRITFDVLDRYLFQFNARYDQSSRFARAYRGAFFPSASFGWVVTEEPFMKALNLRALNFLKLRASYGTLGNEKIGNYPYQSTIAPGTIPMYSGTTIVSAATAAQTAYAIPDITWETTKTWNVGLDLTMFRNRLTFTGDVFQKNTYNMLLSRKLPDVLGYSDPKDNIGDMYTRGWEIQLGWNDRIGDFSYAVSANLSDYKSVMGNLGGYQSLGSKIIQQGVEYNAWYGYQSAGLYQTDEDVAAARARATAPEYGMPAILLAAVGPGDIAYKDLGGADGQADGKISPEYDRVILGSSSPHYQYGGNINLGWRNWNLSMTFQGIGYVLAQKSQAMVFRDGDAYTFPVEYDNWYWSALRTPEQNLRAKYPRATLTNTSKNNYDQTTDYWLFNGAYFRLKNVLLSYTLPSAITRKLNLQTLRVYASATDPFSISKFPQGWDPESYTNLSAYMVKTFTLGLQIAFGGRVAESPAPARMAVSGAQTPARVARETKKALKAEPEIREVIKEVVKEKIVEVEKIVEKPVEIPVSTLKGEYEDDLFFLKNKSELRPEEAFKLGRICQILKDNPDAKIVVTGYADSATGTPEINQRLSEERAGAVAAMLREAGIPADRIVCKSVGSDRDASASPEDNRVAVCIIK